MILGDPMRIYHIEHAAGSGWTPGLGGELLQKRLDKAGVPQLSPEQYASWVSEMAEQRRPIIFNKSQNWGLANENLLEKVVNGGDDS